MSDAPEWKSAALDPNTESAKNVAYWIYLAHCLSLITSLALLSIIPLIINYIKRREAVGSLVASHHSWMIRSFWWYWLWAALGAAGMFMGLLHFLGKNSHSVNAIGIGGLVVFAGAWCWKAYRLLKGLLDLSAGKAMP